MSSIVALEDIELIPVVELGHMRLARTLGRLPSGYYQDVPDDWYRYWLDPLADSGITGLTPVQCGSWNVPTRQFTDPALLRRVLEVTFQKSLEAELSPDCGPLNGALALRCQSQNVLIEPFCCADLNDAADWRNVADYREATWSLLPIGHPSQSVRYRAPCLIISDQHDLKPPTEERWAVCPDQLRVALVPANIELERFARRIADALPSGYEADPTLWGRKLAGLG